MFLRDGLHRLVVEQQGRVLGALHIHLEETLGSKGGIRGDGDAATLAEVQQTLLHEVRVVFDLQRLRHVFGVTLDVQHESTVVIADADGLDQAGVVERFHGVVRLFERGFAQGEFVVFVEETGGVPHRRVDVFQRDGEVDDVQIEVIDAPIRELFLADGTHALFVVERVPELGDEEQLFALHEAVGDGSLYSFAGFFLVAVVASTVEQAVPGLDRVVDLVCARFVCHLPQAEPHEWHGFAIVESDGRGNHDVCLSYNNAVCSVFARSREER